MKIIVTIPAFNEEKTIAKVVGDIGQVMTENSFDYRILLVDDGSKDGTKDIAEDLAAQYDNVNVYSYSQNRGKGYAIKYGFNFYLRLNLFTRFCKYSYVDILFLKSFYKS